MQTAETFWDKTASGYVKSAISDMDAYTFTLERTRSYLKSSDRVLEVGCGSGMTALKLAGSCGEILGTDISGKMVDYARKGARDQGIVNARFLRAGAEDVLAGEGRFNAIMAFNLLHLVPDLPQVLQQYHDMLEPGGLFISKTFSLQDSGFDVKIALMRGVLPLMQMVGKAPEVFFFTVSELDKMVEAAGFDILETGNYPAKPPRRYIVARKRC
ncbi:class I SAM-dependent methyltransferase [Polycladidibacter hongkongensis]|uniref:class I SAM-dependent methyltransferase n=1 Tax=Polycladidibacter hongkongensis TaxID=1647556 RepID=UPI00082D363B|nr:class I SAM-dependent methyltransferase [Pseudovibrio hongkongensis]